MNTCSGVRTTGGPLHVTVYGAPLSSHRCNALDGSGKLKQCLYIHMMKSHENNGGARGNMAIRSCRSTGGCSCSLNIGRKTTGRLCIYASYTLLS